MRREKMERGHFATVISALALRIVATWSDSMLRIPNIPIPPRLAKKGFSPIFPDPWPVSAITVDVHPISSPLLLSSLDIKSRTSKSTCLCSCHAESWPLLFNQVLISLKYRPAHLQQALIQTSSILPRIQSLLLSPEC